MGERPGVSCNADERGRKGPEWGEPGFRRSGKGKWRTGPRKRPGEVVGAGCVAGERIVTQKGTGAAVGSGRGPHRDTDSVLRYATKLRDCYAI